MESLFEKLNTEKFVKNIITELKKLPFGNLPKSELELIIFHSIIESLGGYDNINQNSLFIQRELKISQATFQKKVLDSQLRYDKNIKSPKEILIDYLFKKDISDLVFKDEYLILYVSNPLNKDTLKSFLNSNEIINDSSFNNNILKLHSKDIIKLITLITDNETQIKEFEREIQKKVDLKENVTFSLINNLDIEKLFSLEFSLFPFKSVKQIVEIIRKVFYQSNWKEN